MKKFMKYIAGAALMCLSGTGFGQNANFSLNSSGTSHIYWPYASSSFNSPTGSSCCDIYSSSCPTGTNTWRVSNGTGCGYHTSGDLYAEDWLMSTQTATDGQPFHAPFSGTVKVARDVGNSYGNMLVIQSDQNSSFAFMVAHLKSDVVYEGQYVNAGDLVGYVGASGGQQWIHAHVVLYKGITTAAIDGLKVGNTPPSYMAAPFYMDAVGGSSSGTNLSINASVWSHTSDYGPGYTPWQALDGQLSTKWVSDGVNTTQTMYINLNGNYNVNKFVLKHAGANGEWSAMNTEHYIIKYWNGSAWVLLVDHYNTSQLNTMQHTVNVNTQYLYLSVLDPGVDNYTRLPEWEVYGTGSGARTDAKQPPVEKLEEQPMQLALFPNPAQNTLSVKWQGDSQEQVSIQVINAAGQVVKSMQLNDLQRNDTIGMDITELQPGIYQLALSSADSKEVSSFVKK